MHLKNYELWARYQSLVGGSEPLQSYLHKRLAENLNSEASLGTVTDVAQCVEWVNSTFLSVRAARDPRRYLGLPQNASKQLITKKIEELCVKAMNGLVTSGLITMDEASCIHSTDAGRLMSVYYIDVETMKAIMKIEGTESLEKLLWLVCESHELADMHLRVDERRSLNALNRNNAAATIRFPMKGKINTRQMKLNCIIQAVLGCLPIPDPSLNQEAFKIMRIADRVCKCLIAYVTSGKVIADNRKCFSSVLNAVILAKCLSAHIWENSPYLSKQLKGIGPMFSSLLASAGKTTFRLLEESHPRDLERIMNKSAPAGNDIRKQISLLPKYQLTIVPIDQKSVRIELAMLNQVYLMENMERLTAGPNHKFYLIVGDSENNLLYYSVFKDKDFLSVYDGCITCDVTRKQTNEHKLIAHCISSTFVGIDDNSEYVFKDLNPCIGNNHKLICTPRESVLKQTNITDIFTRKRKSPKQGITQSNEKKKRDTGVIKQFKNLRESLGITSKNIKENLQKTAESTNLNEINEKPQSISSLEIDESNFNDTIEASDTEEQIDDVKIMNILNDIESNKENTDPLTQKTGNTYKIDSSKANFKAMSTNDRHVSFNINKYKRKKTINNLSFIESIEKKSCQNDPLVTESDAGFSRAIRDHLNQFIVNVQHKNTNKIDMHLLLDNDSNHSDAAAESTNVRNTIDKNMLKRDTSPQNTNLIQSTSDSQLVHQKIPIKYKNNNIMDQLQNDKTKDLAIPEHLISLPNNYNDNSNKILPSNNDNRIVTQIDPSLPDKQINPFLPIKYCNIKTRNHLENMHEKPVESNINNLIGYNNFLVQPSMLTSQNRDISLHHDTIPAQNDFNNYQILEIVGPKSIDTLNRNDFKYTNTEDNVDVNQYFFSATKINSCTKVLPERQIHIVGRLKVDFNVMEIKTKGNNSNTDYSEYNNSENDEMNKNIEADEIARTNLDGITGCSNSLNCSPIRTLSNTINNDTKVCYKPTERNTEIENKHVLANNQNTEDGKQNKVVNVKDILQKYQRKCHVRRFFFSQYTPSQSFKESTTECGIRQNLLREPEKDKKPNRQYKIRDFDKINIPLPEALASVITESKINSQTCVKDFNNASNKINEGTIPLDKEEKENAIYLTPAKESFKYTIDDDLSGSPPTDITQNDYDLSQTMLNPKTLLRAVNDEVIVPPPPEFTDTYSPTYDKNDFSNNFNEYYDPEDAISEEKIDYEPNSEGLKEEWTLSREDHVSYTPYESTSQNLSLSESLTQRTIKLNKFKFRKNNNYKFKK
ncbi:unnamed protein product [Pieris macdunnoughi]|uniref:SEC63 domain-containing protein n=1 Tax=Pieris macdunnoughi TaxID=345717 RepID=A0A821TVG4_9NEOP|nr:unnamed protein product [Pieris macdunnoughi]